MYTLRETPPPVYPATIIQVSLQYSLQEYCQQVISRTRRAGHMTRLDISYNLGWNRKPKAANAILLLLLSFGKYLNLN